MEAIVSNQDIDKHAAFIKSLHEEKIRTQSERAAYVTSKFAFITGLFGLGALQFGTIDFSMLLYFIPFVAIGYDLYLRAADLSIKKIGAFLRGHPKAGTAEVEVAWEKFSASHRDRLARFASSLFTYILIIAAAAYVMVRAEGSRTTIFYIGFAAWLVVSLTLNVLLWKSHRDQVDRLDRLFDQ